MIQTGSHKKNVCLFPVLFLCFCFFTVENRKKQPNTQDRRSRSSRHSRPSTPSRPSRLQRPSRLSRRTKHRRREIWWRRWRPSRRLRRLRHLRPLRRSRFEKRERNARQRSRYVRVSALDTVKDDAEAKKRAAEEVFANIRARMEAERSER